MTWLYGNVCFPVFSPWLNFSGLGFLATFNLQGLRGFSGENQASLLDNSIPYKNHELAKVSLVAAQNRNPLQCSEQTLTLSAA